MIKKVVLTVAVYGDFEKKDIRIKCFNDRTPTKFRFQNTLREAGYDCELFSIHDTDINEENE